MRVVIAIPTNGQRADTLARTIEAWEANSCQPIHVEVSEEGETWAAGLNDVYKKHADADIMVLGSDDMYPEDAMWLPVVESFLERNISPVPLMKDPRFVIQGGVISEEEREDGAESHMTNFPVLRKDWLSSVFPLPSELHYFSDDLIAHRLHRNGVKTCYAKDFVIVHEWDPRGRGAGMGSEEARMDHDRQIYKRLTRQSA